MASPKTVAKQKQRTSVTSNGGPNDAKREWEEKVLNPGLAKSAERRAKFVTTSSVEVDRLKTPADLAGTDFERDIGFPGQFPFTRGIHPTMYRGRLWTVRQTAGFASPEESNRRYKYLLAHGQTGLAVALDLPTLYGVDADDPEAAGEVGVCGVPISSLKDMEALFHGIDLGAITTNITINGPAAAVWSMFIAAATKQGVPLDQINGTIQNDILKEYMAQKEFLYPPLPSMRLVTDTLEYAVKHLPKFKPISISGYHVREAGGTALQELAFTLVNGMEYVRWTTERGLHPDKVAPHLSFFFDCHNDIFEEVAKFRAARRIWARFMRDEAGAKDPKSWMLRFHTQTAGCSATPGQPELNIVRTAYQALAAVLGGTQSLHTNGYDEALALPSEKAVRIALRTQQILVHESGVTNTVDPLGGSYFVEDLTNRMEEGARKYFDRVDSLGGVIPALDKGFFQSEIANAAATYKSEIERKDRFIVGENAFLEGNDETPSEAMLKIDGSQTVKHMTERLRKLKRTRDNKKVKACLAQVRRDAQKDGVNLMEPILRAVHAYATLGEVTNTLRDVWGTYRERPVI